MIVKDQERAKIPSLKLVLTVRDMVKCACNKAFLRSSKLVRVVMVEAK